ncbi:MAG TPA: sigma-70 family RNA polymerase sigma factor [Gemmatimonadaceae bacterium]|jgi:RNA polymerase sigma-70 factor (ECF subfamily)|nr:sigma-70 family RNA polymerase sigma factor [Gemmatimonadaceae bacterium]
MDDAALVAGLRAGDPHAFEVMVQQHYPSLYASALSYLGSEVAAEELLETIFSRVWERHAELELQSSLAAYLFSAVRNGAINMVKKSAFADRRQRILAATEEYPGVGIPPEGPAEYTEREDVRTALWRVIDALPERMRAILTLRWREQLDWPEIAAAMEMSSAAVQMTHSRALKRLREQLPRYFGEP